MFFMKSKEEIPLIITELREALFTFTKSEKKHQKDPKAGLKLYESFETKKIDNHDVYIFKFDQQKKKIANPYSFNPKLEIVKHARYSMIPFHIHDYIEMNYVYSGTCIAVVQDRKIMLKQGDICIMDTNVPHTIYDVEENDIVINFLMKKNYFTASMLSRLSSNSIISDFLLEAISHDQKHQRFILFHCQKSLKLTDLVESLLCEYYDPSFCTTDVIEAYMVLIFAELLYSYQNEQSSYTSLSNKTRILAILQFIEENYQTCSLDLVAKEFSFHPNYLSRFIKQTTGKTFKQLLQEQKLNKANFLLITTQESIEKILEDVGYQNHGFFNKIFKERYGTTPKKYRKQKQMELA